MTSTKAVPTLASFILCLMIVRFGLINSDPLIFFCRNSDGVYNVNTTVGRTYRNNLESLLSILVSNYSQPSGFHNYTVGSAETAVYGVFLCQGDTTATECRSCLVNATSDMLNTCRTNMAAVIWREKCMLRYSNDSMFSTLEYYGGQCFCNPQNLTNSGDTTLLDQILSESYSQIARRAAYSDLPGGKKFAVHEANLTGSQKVYTLGQCTPDISDVECETCLRTAITDNGLTEYCCHNSMGGRTDYPSCRFRYELYQFYNAPPPQPLPPLSGPSTDQVAVTATGEKSRLSVGVVAAIPSTIISSIIFFIIYFIFWKKKSMKKQRAKRRAELDDITIDPESLQYCLSDIEIATDNFSEANKIGQGGFGAVYKGKLQNGQDIAVKRLSKSSGQGATEFKNEIAVVAKLQHKNLVRLLGFCLEEEEKILVYEFVPRRSLDYYLFDPERQGLLSWSRRRNIILGIARGLVYLHEDSRLKIVHRDLKASNVLLDECMNPKIADFGMAKICGIDEAEGNTTRIAGTFGYMAPEYTRRGLYSVKSDVFSFGVVILEIITGKKNSSFYQPEEPEDLVSYAWRKWRDGKPLALLDPTVGQSYDENDVIKCIHIGFHCIEEDANKRPTMASVVSMLSNTSSATLPSLHHPVVLKDRGLQNVSTDSNSDQANFQVSLGSINEASITKPYPR